MPTHPRAPDPLTLRRVAEFLAYEAVTAPNEQAAESLRRAAARADRRRLAVQRAQRDAYVPDYILDGWLAEASQSIKRTR